MALEALATDVIKSLGEKLFSLAVKEILFAADTESNVKSLANTKAMIEAVLLDADASTQEGCSRVQRQELEKLSCILDKIDDLLDEKATRSQLKKLAAASGFKDQVRLFFSSDTNPVVSLCRDDRKFKDVYKKVDSITKDRALLDSYLSKKLTKPKPHAWLNLETGSHIISEEVVGREWDRDNIIKSLLDTAARFSVITIVGLGGMGKTTLAQYVYNDESVKKHFDKLLWVHAPRDFDTKEILEKITASATDAKSLHCEMDQLQQRLRREIDGKKYLLVLDDIWDNDRSWSIKWEELRKVLVCSGAGSKVLITTRDERVARIAGSTEPYELGDLGKEESWGQIEQGLKEIGQEILERCPKVSLVIRAIGGLLREQEPTKDKWRAFRDGPLQDLSSAVPDVMELLKLSCNQLGPRLKLCFAYCSLFPRGWEFNKDELIGLWIALGYVEARYQTQNLEEAGEEYVLSLMNRGFFQNAEKDEFGCITGFRMHDMMYDLAVLVTGSKYKMLDTDSVETGHELNERVRHVSFSKAVENLLPLLRKNKENLQSLLLLHSWSNPSELQLNVLSRFRHLTVLRLRRLVFKEAPKSIGKLIHLRYLDLSWNFSIRKLPHSITQLVNLLSLDLNCCFRLVELPRDISKLVKLRHLNLDGCEELSHMPLGLGNLTNLQTLRRFVVRTGNRSNNKGVGGLDGLNCLNNLKGKLELVLDSDFEHGWANDKLVSYIARANLQEKEKLVSLHMDLCHEQSEEKSETALEGLQPHPNGRGYQVGCQIPHNSFPNLVRIELYAFNNYTYLCSFRRLPHLKVLKLVCMDTLEYVENTSTNTGSPHPTPSNPLATTLAPNPLFPSLEQLVLWWMPKLKGWRKIMGTSCKGEEESPVLQNYGYYSAFPRLKKLEFRGVGLEVVPEEFRDLSALESLLLYNCDKLKELPEWIDTLTSLKKLSIVACPKLKSLPKQMANLSNLEELEINLCPILKDARSQQVKIGPSFNMSLMFATSMTTLFIYNGTPILKKIEKSTENYVPVYYPQASKEGFWLTSCNVVIILVCGPLEENFSMYCVNSNE
ncbi:LOW QUALITY PROTEIN: hypothetical protein Cgig2_021223 [Carnegiea gigantea]|uniref:NB-ARC domain-containing protein n=1 Tax=Carnegiea gigantea TaxID=171969 RepID=A0A9Q1QR95_9CARY|nr:LOW QUALITY PROTEIN: hypothetical protein Cgig2_021223 [Carnegiea gigantea]